METEAKPIHANPAISEAVLLLAEARARLELGPTSGRSQRIWVAEADNKIANALRVLADYAKVNP